MDMAHAQADLGPPSTMINGSMRQVFKVSPLDILNRRHLERAHARTQLSKTLFQLVSLSCTSVNLDHRCLCRNMDLR